MNKFEIDFLIKHNYDLKRVILAGTDEAGRGCLAGPLVVSAVILPNDYYNESIKDSKLISWRIREQLYKEIIDVALSYQIVVLSHHEVDVLNPKKASIIGMQRAIANLNLTPTVVLTDAEDIGTNIRHFPIIKGDMLSQSIAAASILAKVHRDRLMMKFDEVYPSYDFKNNKGYATKTHLNALKSNGICEIHRKSYKPVKDVMIDKNIIINLSNNS